MKDAISLDKRLEQKGVTRRDFMKFCSTVAAAIGLGPAFGPKIAEALTAESKPPVVWLHFAECTGCTEAALRSYDTDTKNPNFADLILDTISLDYHETIMAGSGVLVSEGGNTTYQEDYLSKVISDPFICVVEGAIPTADGGIYGMVGGKTMLSIAQEICPQSLFIIAIGTCASYGGLPAAAPNLTGAKGVGDALGTGLNVPVVNIPGCPPNPVNFVGAVSYYLLNHQLPQLDNKGRPQFAYGKRVHDQCPYHEDGRYGEDRCLEDMGCKGKHCYNNCPSIQFNMGTSWPVAAGHPCIGCSEPNFWDTMTPFYREYGEGSDHGYEGRDDSREHDD